MKRLDALVLLGVCVVWALHYSVMRAAVQSAPPLLYAATRMALLSLVLLPLLRVYPGQMLKVFAVAACLGGLNFATFFIGISLASASQASIAAQLAVPFATILSVLFLGERVRWRRGLGIALAFAGTVIVGWQPGKIDASIGVLFISVGAFLEAAGAIFVKALKDVPPIRLQAWVGVVGFAILATSSLVFEDGQAAYIASADGTFWAAIAYSALGASLFAFTAYYWLLQRMPVSQAVTGTSMTPVLGVLFAALLLDEPLTFNMLVGGVIALTGVFIILRRTETTINSPVTTVRENF